MYLFISILTGRVSLVYRDIYVRKKKISNVSDKNIILNALRVHFPRKICNRFFPFFLPMFLHVTPVDTFPTSSAMILLST